MSDYTEADLPVTIMHGEMLTLADGTTIRFESNGEAKDIMVNDGFAPETTLFPANDYIVEASGSQYKLTAKFEDALDVVKL